MLDIRLCSSYRLLIRDLMRLSPRMFLLYLSRGQFGGPSAQIEPFCLTLKQTGAYYACVLFYSYLLLLLVLLLLLHPVVVHVGPSLKFKERRPL